MFIYFVIYFDLIVFEFDLVCIVCVFKFDLILMFVNLFLLINYNFIFDLHLLNVKGIYFYWFLI